MKLGFNSNVRISDRVYHVQTEKHGSEHPYIDTLVLFQGQVLHRRSTSYQDLLEGGALDEAMLGERVEQQHRSVLQALQSGSLLLEGPAPGESAAIELKLRNAQSWLADGRVSLELQVCSRRDGHSIPGAEIVARIEGAAGESHGSRAETDAQGCALLQFALPELANPEMAALVIQAHTAQGQHQIRYRLKAKTRGSAPAHK